MIAVIQRVNAASVMADGVPAGKCEKGLLILLGVAKEDGEEDAALLAAKIAKLRIFCDGEDKMNLSLLDIEGGALVVSNFTLLANYAHGNRPDYFAAAAPGEANALYERFCELLAGQGIPVEKGVFGADMRITLEADGPVTIVMDSVLLQKKNRK